MKTTRRKALVALSGLVAAAGCLSAGRSVPSDALVEQAETTRPETETPTEAQTTRDPMEVAFEDSDVDIFVYESDGLFRAVDRSDDVVARSEDLGRVLNDAQDVLSEGQIVVGADGPVGTGVSHGDAITIRGADRRPEMTPAEGSDRSFVPWETTGGPRGGRLASFHVDMRRRGGSGVRLEGFSELEVDEVWIANAAENGLVLAGGEFADVRNCRFESLGNDAIQVVDSAGVTVEGCESAGDDYGVYVDGSTDVEIRGYRSEGARFNSVALYEYTENWTVVDCEAVDSGHTPFAASPALNGSFVDCTARGTTADGEGGFEIEYKAGHDDDNRKRPVEGCSVVSCRAVDCHMGFYAREDDRKYTTGTPVVRPTFRDCTAVDCDVGLYLGDNVVEAVVDGFEAVGCATDVVDEGTRTIRDGRSENVGDPSVEGQWNGHAATAAELDVTVYDTESGVEYRGADDGTWRRIS